MPAVRVRLVDDAVPDAELYEKDTSGQRQDAENVLNR